MHLINSFHAVTRSETQTNRRKQGGYKEQAIDILITLTSKLVPGG